jgi:Na+-translocating ferredoxin:NAD+ oxidoreductase RnfG subunit
LDDGLSLKGGIVAITGATLTANAVTDAARRVLALRQVIDTGHGARP